MKHNEPNLIKGLTAQQRQLLAELVRRESDGRGAQTAWDFDGFATLNPGSAARGSLERLCKRGLVEIVAERPRTYRATVTGRSVVWND